MYIDEKGILQYNKVGFTYGTILTIHKSVKLQVNGQSVHKMIQMQ